MILVTLGTQDKSFVRLLKTIEKAKKKGIIQDEIVVQGGYTTYQSDAFQVFDLIPMEEFEQLMDEASLVITHGGVGSILTALQKGKKVIAAPRLKKYKEHTNNHQIEIVDAFAKEGYLLPLKDFSQFAKIYKKSQTFQPKKYTSHQKQFEKAIEGYLVEHQSWYNRYKEGLLYLFFGGCTTLINLLVFYLLDLLQVNPYLNNTIAWIVAVLFAYVTNKYFVFESKEKKGKKAAQELGSFFVARVLSYGIDMGGLYLFYQLLSFPKMLVKIGMNIVVILFNYIVSKLFIFRKKEIHSRS